MICSFRLSAEIESARKRVCGYVVAPFSTEAQREGVCKAVQSAHTKASIVAAVAEIDVADAGVQLDLFACREAQTHSEAEAVNARNTSTNDKRSIALSLSLPKKCEC